MFLFLYQNQIFLTSSIKVPFRWRIGYCCLHRSMESWWWEILRIFFQQLVPGHGLSAVSVRAQIACEWTQEIVKIIWFFIKEMSHLKEKKHTWWNRWPPGSYRPWPRWSWPPFWGQCCPPPGWGGGWPGAQRSGLCHLCRRWQHTCRKDSSPLQTRAQCDPEKRSIHIRTLEND